LVGGWLCFAIAAVTYLMTMEPSASLWDCGEFIATSYKLEVGHPPGAPLFMMVTRFFQIFAPSPGDAAMMANAAAALSSAGTILFLFWTITMLALKWFGKKAAELSRGEIWAVLGAGLIGSLGYAFTDTFWFSAVEAEVYALSSFFTAIVFWAMLRWEQVADEPHSNRWLVLIAYLMGLSIGVHLLNLLAFPAMVFLYYFRKYPKVTRRGVIGALGVSVAVVVFVLYVICPWTVRIGAWTDRLFVNSFGLPVNSGMAVYAIALFVLLGWGVWSTYKKRKIVWNTFMLMTTVVILGYSSYASVIIRSAANPPMNSNDPSNPYGLMMLLSRDQYGSRPLISGHTYASPVSGSKQKTYYYVGEEGKYVPYSLLTDYQFPSQFNMLFPRLHSDRHEAAYKEWVKITGRPISYGGEVYTQPTFGENLQFFFKYQLNHMYWRYFMWNFVGRQNDEQGLGGVFEGNWLSGVNAIDQLYLGPQNDLPESMKESRARNLYYFLPFILGLMGILTQLKQDKKGFTVVMWLFFMTGIAIILYLNQTPDEPRERDYAYAGSFYAFSIWIGLGVLCLYDMLNKALKKRRLSAAVATVLCLSVPAILCAQNWDDHDRSGRYVARDIGRNYLESCLPNSIIMNWGDNDTFPLWYNQEVEGVRPDVRVMNLSYLAGEWYIDQMKLKVNDSDPVPFTIPRELYYGKNASLLVEDLTEGRPQPIGDVVDWIKSGHPATQVRLEGGSSITVVPARKILLPVNKENAIASGIVRPEDAHLMVDTIELNITGNQIDRVSMMLLDLFAHFDWKRPLYFTNPHSALTTLGLMDYLQQDGLAYRFVPIRTPYAAAATGRIDTEYLYDKLMNTFRYGNIGDLRVNCDYFVRYTINATRIRTTFTRLSNELVQQGDTVRAREVLDRLMHEIPSQQVPPIAVASFFEWRAVIQAHYVAGETEKANGLMAYYIGRLKEMLAYCMQFPERKQQAVYSRMQEDLYLISELARLADTYGQTEIADEIETFFQSLGV
jgi:hypothetical protein